MLYPSCGVMTPLRLLSYCKRAGDTARGRKVIVVDLLVVSEPEVLLIKKEKVSTYGFFPSFVFRNSFCQVMKGEGERWT